MYNLPIRIQLERKHVVEGDTNEAWDETVGVKVCMIQRVRRKGTLHVSCCGIRVGRKD